ncbi:MAG TPA: efflux RND transporter periplasmic adaptor subunit [bacterium]|nr:efflux RND transporter periplasmic adaptor subunit [bacterium]HOL48020.1 efflux RND transporter periplasmic adaptor subunit [bacterium]HPQ19568.1 efflux RND transporter periplasmic adaptor subunit [bacterium]
MIKKIYLIKILLIISIFGLASCVKKNVENKKEEERINVKLYEVKEEKIAQTISLQGNLLSKENAIIAAKVDGIIEKLYIDEGMFVIKDKTKLFKIESENLENNNKIQKYNLEMAKYKLEETKANYDKVKAENEKVIIDYNRYKRLYEKNIITGEAFEQQEARYKQSNAMLKYAETLVRVSEEAIRQAEAAYEISSKKLADAEIYAPINGYISKKFQKEGETVRFGSPIFQIDNISKLEVSAFLPAEYYSKINIGKTKIDIEVNEVKINDLVVFYKSPIINPVLRTFEIKALVQNNAEQLAPGEIVEIKVYLTDEYYSVVVPKSSIKFEENKKYVYIVNNDKVERIEIKTGIEENGMIEILSGLKKGQKIINEGLAFVREGQLVRVIE